MRNSGEQTAAVATYFTLSSLNYIFNFEFFKLPKTLYDLTEFAFIQAFFKTIASSTAKIDIHVQLHSLNVQ